MNAISMLIDGEPRPAADGATFERRNPLDPTVATRAPAATAADAVAAVRCCSARLSVMVRHGALGTARAC